MTDRLKVMARECRDRADEVLARRDGFKDLEARLMMWNIAEGYVALADRLERAAAAPEVNGAK